MKFMTDKYSNCGKHSVKMMGIDLVLKFDGLDGQPLEWKAGND